MLISTSYVLTFWMRERICLYVCGLVANLQHQMGTGLAEVNYYPNGACVWV